MVGRILKDIIIAHQSYTHTVEPEPEPTEEEPTEE
jgi:hypothetical protein